MALATAGCASGPTYEPPAALPASQLVKFKASGCSIVSIDGADYPQDNWTFVDAKTTLAPGWRDIVARVNLTQRRYHELGFRYNFAAGHSYLLKVEQNFGDWFLTQYRLVMIDETTGRQDVILDKDGSASVGRTR